jgi:hypothetical protein
MRVSLALLLRRHGDDRTGGWVSRAGTPQSRPRRGLPESARSRSEYSRLSSLLRRNERMLLSEQLHIDQWLANRSAGGESYWDLVLSEVFGCQSQRRREQAAAFRQRRRRLTWLRLLITRATSALDDGNLELAERILRHTSPQLGILADDADPTSVERVPVLGDPDVAAAEETAEAT